MRVAWQALMSAMIVVALAINALSLVFFKDAGDFGFTVHRVPSGGVVVDSVARGGAAAQAGIHTGDLLRTDPTFDARVVWTSPRAGESANAYLGPERVKVTLVARPLDAAAPIVIVSEIIFLAFLAMGAIIASRKRDDDAGRALATFLVCFGCAMTIDGFVFQSTILRFASYLATEGLFFTGGVALLVFACRFPALATSGFRAVIVRFAIPIALTGIAISWSRFFLFFIAGNADAMRVLIVPFAVYFAALLAATLFCFIISARQSEASQRVQMRWVVWTFGAGFSGLLVTFGAIIAGVGGDWAQYPSLTIALVPVGLGYMILRHRVLDISFVINRAVVYGAVSLIMITAFIVFEWLIGTLVQKGTGASLVLNVVGAIGLGFSVRYIHERVDRRIDDLFFRERHLAEAAVRRFGHEAALITQTSDLMQKTIEVAQRNIKLEGAAFYSADDGVFAPRLTTIDDASAVSENDYAVLAMRSFHKPIDLTEFDTKVPGEYAFPMIVRGSLAGFLACGPKASHEALAPDELDALGALARDCGIALDSLRVSHIERELGEARAALAALVAHTQPKGGQPAF